MRKYSSSSLYYTTPIKNNKLDLWNYRSFPFEQDDLIYQIEDTYNWRPDLLAHDLYSDHNLWWVFAIRNPGVIKDPVFDFTTGTTIYLPKLNTLSRHLSI